MWGEGYLQGVGVLGGERKNRYATRQSSVSLASASARRGASTASASLSKAYGHDGHLHLLQHHSARRWNPAGRSSIARRWQGAKAMRTRSRDCCRPKQPLRRPSGTIGTSMQYVKSDFGIEESRTGVPSRIMASRRRISARSTPPSIESRGSWPRSATPASSAPR